MEASKKLGSLGSPPTHRTLAERAYAVLHDAIIGGQFEPGERLRIEDLATRLETSPMPVREALRRLAAEGLVDNVPHRGATVRELTVDDLREVFDARIALEALAARRAAERFTETDRIRAAEALDQQGRAYRRRNMAGAAQAHRDFYAAIYGAAGSRWLLRLLQPLWDACDRYSAAVLPVSRRLDERSTHGEHGRVLEACADHDPELAAARVSDQLARTANAIAAEMGAEEDPFVVAGTAGPAAAGVAADEDSDARGERRSA